MKNLENNALQQMRENLIESVTIFGENESKTYKNFIHIGNTFDGERSVFTVPETDENFVVSNTGGSINFDLSTDANLASLKIIFDHFAEQLGKNDILQSYLIQLQSKVKSAIKFTDDSINKNQRIKDITMKIRALKTSIMSNTSKEEHYSLLDSILEALKKSAFINGKFNVVRSSDELEISWFLGNLQRLENTLNDKMDLTLEINRDSLIQILVPSLIPLHSSDGYFSQYFKGLDDFISRFIDENYYEDYDKQNFLVNSLFDFIVVNGMFDLSTLEIPNENTVSDDWKLVINSIKNEFKRQHITDYENDDIYPSDFFDALLGDYYRHQFEFNPFEYATQQFKDIVEVLNYLAQIDTVPHFDNFIKSFGEYLGELKVFTTVNGKRNFGATYTHWQPAIEQMITHNLFGKNVNRRYYENILKHFDLDDLQTEPFTTIGSIEEMNSFVLSLIEMYKPFSK